MGGDGVNDIGAGVGGMVNGTCLTSGSIARGRRFMSTMNLEEVGGFLEGDRGGVW